MKVTLSASPFGSNARTRVLLALRLLSESYARELSRFLGLTLSSVQKAIISPERGGLIAGWAVARARLFRLSPRAFARRELEREDELRVKAAIICRRPRRSGKRL